MPLEEDALEFAFKTYNGTPSLQLATVEWGYVLYEDDRGALLPGPRVLSPNSDSVQLYDMTAMLRILRADEAFSGHHLGDYHAHPRGQSWMSQFPSPEDVAQIGSASVITDLWPNKLGELVDAAPRVQLIQSLLFGDVFLLAPTSERVKFSSFAQQDLALQAIQAAYAAAHRSGNNVHGGPPAVPTPAQFDAVVSAVLPNLVRAFDGRASMTFVKNEEGAARKR